MFRVVGLFLLFAIVYAKHENYDGYAVYEFSVKNEKEAEMVSFLEEHLSLDIWAHAGPSRVGKMLVPKFVKEEFEVKLKAAGITYKMEVENIKPLLDLEDKLMASAASRNSTRSRLALPFDRILEWEQIDAFIDMFGEEYPETVSVVTGGYSFEGRPIKYLKISTTNFQDTSKPIVYMESLLHAREWITQAATLYALEKLILDVTEEDLLNDIDWIIVPVANPDGFVHTHESGRFWRKNRATGYMIADICMGVDLNRNFDVFFGTASSNSACTDTFHGTNGFSESETAVVRDIIHEHVGRMELFLDIHSFGSWILYGYGNGELPPNALTVNLVGVQMAEAIDRVKLDYNPNYVVGNVAMILYQASGSAADYAMAAGVPLTYTYELPGYRGFGQTLPGFLVDPSFIEQAGFETWEGIKVAARYARSSYRQRMGF